MVVMVMMMMMAPELSFDPFAVPSSFLGFVAFLALLRQSTTTAAAVGQFFVIFSGATIITVLIGLLGSDALDA